MTRQVIVGAALAQRPGYAGHAWAILQYLLGFRELGWEVLLLDRLGPDSCSGGFDPEHPERAAEFRSLAQVMRDFALDDDFAVVWEPDGRVLGMDASVLRRRMAAAALLIDVMGYVRDVDWFGRPETVAFLDIDPGFGQMWCELGLADLYDGHDAFVTVGWNLGRDGCSIPTCRREWSRVRPPVVLGEWPCVPASGRAVTSVASWRGPYAPVDFAGERHGLRVHEFRRLTGLPGMTDARLELALDIHPSDEADLALLRREGWGLVDPRLVAGDPHAYRAYIQASQAELSVAKEMYVKTASGWFSDRSATYLASGRPVVAQDTGLEDLTDGAGLLTFTDVRGARDGLGEMMGDYERHARAARALAEEHLDARRVLSGLLSDLGLA